MRRGLSRASVALIVVESIPVGAVSHGLATEHAAVDALRLVEYLTLGDGQMVLSVEGIAAASKVALTVQGHAHVHTLMISQRVDRIHSSVGVQHCMTAHVLLRGHVVGIRNIAS